MKTCLMIILTALVLAGPRNAWCRQHSDRGTVEGLVQKGDGKPIRNANVLIAGTTLGAATTETGRFSIRAVPPGEHTIIFRHLGYGTTEKKIHVVSGAVTTISVFLEESILPLATVVVTGTRTEKTLENVPIVTAVVPRRELQLSGGTDLRSILAEQTGLGLVNDHGTGIQVQGFDPAYTLILIDGEPMIGRTAGTLELSRLNVGNVERIEIVKGPSSSLYGSEALAGVINVITCAPTKPWSGSVQARASRFDSYDLGTSLEHASERFGGTIFLNRKSSSGYDLTPATISPTVAPYVDYTFNSRVTHELDENTTISLGGRFYKSDQESKTTIAENGQTVTLEDRSALTEWNIAPAVSHRVASGINTNLKFFSTRYTTHSDLDYLSGSAYSRSLFDQAYRKVELQADLVFGDQWLASAGVGYIRESVKADRIDGGERSAGSGIAYAQGEWIPSRWIDLIVSARYDAHSDYAARLSPKIAALTKPFDWLHFRASIGSGFKAPTFQQLYLDFTNPTVGYSVFGSVGVRDQFARLVEQGQIQSMLINPESLNEIRAENSVAFNVGTEIILPFNLTASINLFHNTVHDMIESSPIAVKTNGQSVFTYFNLKRVSTRGLESDFRATPMPFLTVSLGYQYLEALDMDVLEQIRNGAISKTGSTGRLRPVQETEYGGLFGRARHSGVVKITYDNPGLGTAISLRGMLRGPYGFSDRNLNGVLDDDAEYAPGYALWNASITQQITSGLALQAGAENLLDKKDPERLPSVPGRFLFASVQLNLSSLISSSHQYQGAIP